MNDDRNDDADVRTLLAAACDLPTDEFRSLLGATLVDGAAGRDTVQIAARRAVEDRRRPWPMMIAAAVAAAALTVGIAAIGRRGDEPVVPTTGSGLTGPGEPTGELAAADIVDGPWIADGRDGAMVPTIRFTGSDVVYTDGCGEYRGPWDPSVMTIGDIAASWTFADCAPTGTGAAGATISGRGGVMVLSSPDGTVAEYTRVDDLDLATAEDLVGWWALDDLVIRFEPGAMYLENCSDNWSITDHLVTYRTLADPSCFGGFTTRHGQVLQPMLGSTDLVAVRSGDDVLLVDGDTTLRLTAAAAPPDFDPTATAAAVTPIADRPS